jgi:hypothetical protein
MSDQVKWQTVAKFPDLTQAEHEAGFDKVIVDRGLKPDPE